MPTFTPQSSPFPDPSALIYSWLQDTTAAGSDLYLGCDHNCGCGPDSNTPHHDAHLAALCDETMTSPSRDGSPSKRRRPDTDDGGTTPMPLRPAPRWLGTAATAPFPFPPLQLHSQQPDNTASESMRRPPNAAATETLSSVEDDVFSIAPAYAGQRPAGPGPVPPFPPRSQAPSSTQSTTAGSRISSSPRRSKSPVKKVADLRYFAEPVSYRPLDGPAVQLPAELQDLSDRIAVVTSGEGVLPASIKDTIRASSPRERFPDFFFNHHDDQASPGFSGRDEPLATALDTHARLIKVVESTRQSIRWARSEAAWNLYVHAPMLELGLATVGHVRPELITTAQILPDFLPLTVVPTAKPTERNLATSSAAALVTSQQKMVDFALALEPEDGSPLQTSITRLLERHLPLGQKSVNHSDYGPLCEMPAPVAIETKTAAGSEEEAKVQLGVWTAAWFRRMKMLVRQSNQVWPSPVEGVREDEIASSLSHMPGAVISVPLLLVMGERWMMLYACEKDNRITIYGSDSIGDTNTVLGIYKLLRSLRAVGSWITTRFLPWFTANIVGLELDVLNPQNVLLA